MATASKTSASKPLPVPDGDFYNIKGTLFEDESQILDRVRTFMEDRVAPIINDFHFFSASA